MHLKENTADDAMQMNVHKTFYPFYTRKKMPHVMVTMTKKRFVGSNSQVYYYYENLDSSLSAHFQNAGYFFSSKYCRDLQRKNHRIAVVFNETTNYNFILLSKQGRTQLIYSTELTTEHVFENFRGELPG